MAFVNPAGSMTGKLFPTGSRQNSLMIHPQSPYVGAPFTVQVTMIDAANPFIFVDSVTLPEAYHQDGADSQRALDIVEAVRREGAVHFGLAADTEAAALVRGTPKIAVLSPPPFPSQPDLALTWKPRTPDIHVTAYSMGKVHPSFQLTGAVCLGSALSIPGTVAFDISKMRREWTPTPPGTPSEGSDHSLEEGIEEGVVRQKMTIAHRAGQMEVLVEVVKGEQIESITVFRTARRLFEGSVLVGL